MTNKTTGKAEHKYILSLQTINWLVVNMKDMSKLFHPLPLFPRFIV